LPEAPTEILLSFSFEAAGRTYAFDDVGPIRVNWVESIAEDVDSDDYSFRLYIDGGGNTLDLTVPTRSWNTGKSYEPGWTYNYGTYYPAISVQYYFGAPYNGWYPFDTNYSDSIVYWDGPYKINGSVSGGLHLWTSQLLITSIEPLPGYEITEDVSHIKMKIVMAEYGITYTNIPINVTWSERYPLEVYAYEVHPDAPLSSDVFFYLYQVEEIDGVESTNQVDEKRGGGRTTFYPWEGTWQISAWSPGLYPRVSGLYGDAWSDLIQTPPSPTEPITLSFVNDSSTPSPYAYWRDTDDETDAPTDGRYQIIFDIPVKIDGLSQYISLWKNGEQIEAEIIPVRPMNDPEYGNIAVLFNIVAVDGFQESDFAAHIKSYYTVQIDPGVVAYNNNTQSRLFGYTVEAYPSGGGGGEELPKLGLGPDSNAGGSTEPPDDTDPPGGTNPPGDTTPKSPTGTTVVPVTLEGSAVVKAPVVEISSEGVPLTPGLDVTMEDNESDNRNDDFKGTQSSGSPSASTDTPISLVIGGIAVLAVAAGTGAVLLFRRSTGRLR
jgi:hypothetical protein